MEGAKKRSGRVGVYGALRALGAFRSKGQSLKEALSFEMTTELQRAAVPLHNVRGEAHEQALCKGVHVLFDSKSVERVYGQDVWSERRFDGSLVATTNVRNIGVGPYGRGHAECFTRRGSHPVAIVAAEFEGMSLSSSAVWEMIEAAKKFGVPIISLSEVKPFLRGKTYFRLWAQHY